MSLLRPPNLFKLVVTLSILAFEEDFPWVSNELSDHTLPCNC